MTRPLEWMKAVRDHPERPPAMQGHVLTMLALRMDWSTGCGFASAGQLAADADVDERTVRRATKWGRDHEVLVQARRGHRLGDGRTIASEWRLAIPQPDTGDPLTGISTGQGTHLNRTEMPSQPDTTTPPSRPRSSRPRSSARVDGAKAPRTPRSTTNDRVRQAIEAGKRLQAMFDAQAQPAPEREPVDVAAEIAKTKATLARLNGRPVTP